MPRPVGPIIVLATGATLAAVVLSVLLASRPGPPPSAASVTDRARSIVIIDLAGVRADHLSLYGFPRPTTPRLEALAARSVVFESAYTSAVTTLPATASLFTGLRPRAHGLLHPIGRLPASYPTLAELLRRQGFRTAAFVDGFQLERRYGLDQGFDRYDDVRNPGGQRVNGFRRVLPTALDWMQRNADEPFFLYLQTFDASAPYWVEEEYADELGPRGPSGDDADRLARLRAFDVHRRFSPEPLESFAALGDRYDATLRFVDERIGAVVDHLEEIGRLDDTLLVITSPHGTSLLDRGVYAGNGLSLFDEEVRIPMVVKFPGDRHGGTRVTEVVRRIDVLPTVAAWVGVALPEDAAGVDLIDGTPRVAYGTAPLLYRPGDPSPAGRSSYVRRGDLKLLQAPRVPLEVFVHQHLQGGSGGSTYDLERDPFGLRRRVPSTDALYDVLADAGETADQAEARPDVVGALLLELERIDAEDNAIRDRHAAIDPEGGELNR